MRKSQPAESAWTWSYWRDQSNAVDGYSEFDQMMRASYQAFVAGNASTAYIRTPDGIDMRHPFKEGTSDPVCAGWDEWLASHPSERADWDSSDRGVRLEALKARHVLDLRLFTKEDILAHPEIYRSLSRVLGLSDAWLEAFLPDESKGDAIDEGTGIANKDLRSKSREPAASHDETIPLFLPKGLRFARSSQLVSLSHCQGTSTRAVVYCRTSRPNDPFLTRQKHATWKYCIEHGYRIEATFADTKPPARLAWSLHEVIKSEGVMAAAARWDKEAPRYPGYDAACETIEKRRADILVVYSPDRLIDSKKAFANIVSCLPPVVFVTTWQYRTTKGASA